MRYIQEEEVSSTSVLYVYNNLNCIFSKRRHVQQKTSDLTTKQSLLAEQTQNKAGDMFPHEEISTL